MNSGITKEVGRDPNSKRRRKKVKGAKGGKCPQGEGDAEGQKGDSQPTVEAPHLTVQEFSKKQSLDRKYVC